MTGLSLCAGVGALDLKMKLGPYYRDGRHVNRRLSRSRKKRLDKSRSWKVTRFKCVECGKLSTGRLPRDGRYVGDGTVRYPRRHKGPGGKPCPGNIKEAEWVIVEVNSPRVLKDG